MRAGETHIYVDTSFLMWMVRIGKDARRQLISWLEELAPGRLHVPVWSAHELYRHHVDQTIVKELKDTLKALDTVAQKSFHLVWPLLSEPIGGAPSAVSQRSEARDALSAIRGFAEHAGKWPGTYETHANEVIEFVNRHGLSHSDPFARFETIEGLAASRFTGRIPPGFQDRNKAEIDARQDKGQVGPVGEEAGDSFRVGSNKWGDLIFWQEILDDARQRRASSIAILTRDVKNDWRMAGTLPARDDAGEGEPPPHPMLSYEAAQYAGVCDLVLLDQKRIARILDVMGLGGEAFVAAAQPPPPPAAKSQADVRSEVTAKQMSARAEERSSEARQNGHLFLDRVGLEVSSGRLRRALVDTEGDKRTTIPRVVELAGDLEEGVAAGQAVDAIFTEAALTDLDHVGLVALARHIGISALQRPALEPLVNELVAMLSRLPPRTATCTYFGFLSAMYLEISANSFRVPARTCAAAQIFRLQSADFAALPIEILRSRAATADKCPIYLLDPAVPEIPVQLEFDADRATANTLRAIWIGDHQLLTPAQGREDLQLSARLGDAPATPQLLLDHVAELYTLPRSQMVAATNVTTAFALEDLLGFKEPGSVFDIPGQEERI